MEKNQPKKESKGAMLARMIDEICIKHGLPIPKDITGQSREQTYTVVFKKPSGK